MTMTPSFPQGATTPVTPQLPMGVEIAIPFRIDPSTGGVAVHGSYTKIIAQHLETVVRTIVGERLMNPSYGTQVDASVFNPSYGLVSGVLADDIKKALQRYERSAHIQGVRIRQSRVGPSVVDIEIDFCLLHSLSVNTLTVALGGRLIEVTNS